MNDRFFIDTNVIVYLFDRDNPGKQATAAGLMKKALETGTGAVSYQVIQEFSNVALRKFARPLSIEDCRLFLTRFLFPICPIYPGQDLYNLALDVFARSGYGFYDSLIIASALQAGCRTLFTEDLQHGQKIMGITILNPFRD